VSYEEAEKILLPVMDALAAVHSKGIVHRDVTPDNIYITKDGTVKLLDFGAARYSLGDKSRSLDVVLKHGFAPKEQYTRHGKQGPFTDVYSLGATFYFAITGRRPPDSIDRLEEDELIPPSSLGIAIPSAKEDAILKAMNVQPADRYPNMIEFRAALSKTPTPQEQPQPEPEQPTVVQTEPEPVQQKNPKRWILPVGIGACVVGVAAIITGIVIASGAGKNKDTQVANYEEDGGGSYRGNRDLEKETQDTEPETDTTEPETQVSGMTIVGNDPNNITNGGTIVVDGENLYLYYPGVGLICTDGDNSVIIDADAKNTPCISVVGDYLYYIKSGRAYYAKKDGSGSPQEVPALQDQVVYDLWVAEEGFFYRTCEDFNVDFNYTLKYVDSSEENQKSLSGIFSTVTFMDDYVYYVASDTLGGVQICRASVSDLEEETVFTFTDFKNVPYCGCLAAADDMIYAQILNSEYDTILIGYSLSSGKSYEYSLSDWFGEIKTLYSINAGDGYVYLGIGINDSLAQLCRMSVSNFVSGGGNIEEIYTITFDNYIGDINLLSDEGDLAYYVWLDGGYVLAVMPMDGSEEPSYLGGN
jgi:hypothetical protein